MAESRPTTPRGRGRPGWRRLFGPVSLAVVAAVALAIGGGLFRTSPPSVAARVAAIESVIRCPNCEDLSVAQSSSSAAIAARNQVRAMVVAGRSDAEIEQSFVARYGPTILLRPGTNGLVGLVWLLPVLAGTAALFALAVLFWRRQRAFTRLGAPT